MYVCLLSYVYVCLLSYVHVNVKWRGSKLAPMRPLYVCRSCMYVCVCTYVGMYVWTTRTPGCMKTNQPIYTHISLHTYTYQTHVYQTHKCTYIRTYQVHTHSLSYISYPYINSWMHIYLYIYVCIYIYMCVCVCVCVCTCQTHIYTTHTYIRTHMLSSGSQRNFESLMICRRDFFM